MRTTLFTGSSEQDRYYDFHGTSIAITANRSDVLDAMHIQFRHFSVDRLAGAPDLTFIFHDTATVQLPIEKPGGTAKTIYGLPQGVEYFDSQELLYIDRDNGFKALCHASQGLARISLPQESTRLQIATHFLFRLCWFEMLKRHNLYHIHAAGLSIGGQGLLIAGATGAGKSTLTVALLRAGFSLLGDDTLFLSQGEEGTRALAFPDEIDVTDQTVGFFSELSALSDVRKNLLNKTQVAAERVYQTGWVASCIPRVLLFPRVANTSTSVLKPLEPEQALFEMTTNIMLTETRFSQAHLDALAGLIRQCACYRLETGRDFDMLPDRLRELLQSHS